MSELKTLKVGRIVLRRDPFHNGWNTEYYERKVHSALDVGAYVGCDGEVVGRCSVRSSRNDTALFETVAFNNAPEAVACALDSAERYLRAEISHINRTLKAIEAVKAKLGEQPKGKK